MAVLELASTAVAAPSSLRVSLVDKQKIDSNAAGLTVIDRLARKRRLEIEWRYLTDANMKTILTQLANVVFNTTYYDPVDGASKSINCYVVNIEMGVQKHSGSAATGWEDVKLELQEQ